MLHQYVGKEQHLRHGEFIRLQSNVEKVQIKKGTNNIAKILFTKFNFFANWRIPHLSDKQWYTCKMLEN